jgi:hypothetical protein
MFSVVRNRSELKKKGDIMHNLEQFINLCRIEALIEKDMKNSALWDIKPGSPL